MVGLVSNVSAHSNNIKDSVYLGVDAQRSSSISFKDGFGDNVFSDKPINNLNLFLGAKVSKLIGF